jgi:hypothetical protein
MAYLELSIPTLKDFKIFFYSYAILKKLFQCSKVLFFRKMEYGTEHCKLFAALSSWQKYFTVKYHSFCLKGDFAIWEPGPETNFDTLLADS